MYTHTHVHIMFNATIASTALNSTHSTPPSKTLAHLIDGVLFSISVAGTIENSVAMWILSSSHKISTSKSYVLLMNQSLTDVCVSLCNIIYLLTKYLLPWTDMEGLGDWFLCQVIYNHLAVVITTTASSFNLASLSLGRMVSLVWPIQHMVHFTKTRTIAIAVSVWITAASMTTCFAIPMNGIDRHAHRCLYWRNFSSDIHSKIYYISFSVLFTLIPLAVMFSAYTVIYFRLRGQCRVKDAVKLNVMRMLATCVLLFFLCHFPRAILSIYSRFTHHSLYHSPMFVLSIVMVELNTIVNPIIYSLQYMDYKVELKRQYNRLIRRRKLLYSSK